MASKLIVGFAIESFDRGILDRSVHVRAVFDVRHPRDAVALETAVKGRTAQVRYRGLKGVEAVVERQERVLAEGGGDDRFVHLATVLGLMPYRLERLLRV